MSERPESLARTLGVAAGVALACSLLVATAVHLLRPIERAYGLVDRNRAILDASGLAEPGEPLTDREVVERFLVLEPWIVDLDRGAPTDTVDPAGYDYRAAADDPSLAEPIPPELDTARLGTRPRYMPVYLLRSGGRIERIVLPFYGRGMWSTIYGFVALQGDFTTVAGVAIDEQGETPGIGDRIENPAWLARWEGKRLYGPDGALRFRISTDATAAPAAYRVDGITGATVTVSAVDAAMRYWFSSSGYEPLLARLRAEN